MCVIEERPVIETQRLTLRVPAKADIERVAAFCVDHDVARMTTRSPAGFPSGRSLFCERTFLRR